MSPSIETNGYGSLFPVTLRNNLFLAGSLNFNDYNNYCFYQDITVADNLFVQCAFSYYSDLGYGPRNISYNGWYQTTALHGSAPSGAGACGTYGPAVSGGDVLLTNLDFQSGPLGNYYYPPTGTNLARLIDAGDMSASAAGLANYTTQTNQTPDTGTVDIGYHYATFLELTAQCNTNGAGVELNWTNGLFAQELIAQGNVIVDYNLYRASMSGGTYTLIDTTADATETNYLDLGATPGDTYYYVVTFNYYDPYGVYQESPPSNEAGLTVCCPTTGGTNLWVDYGPTPHELAQWLMSTNPVTVANATFTGAPVAIGIFGNGSAVGLPTGAPGLPIDVGVILSSGPVTNAIGPNNDDGSIAEDNGSSDLETNGDSDLDNLVGGRGTEDAAVLEFDIIATNSFTLQFQYIFASEEYPEFISSPPDGFIDPMAIFVSTNRVGTNWLISVTNDLALVPGTTNMPVSVNNINGGCVSDYYGNYDSPTNPQYYVDNHDPNPNDVAATNAAATPVYNLQYDGFTTLLTAQTRIMAGVTNHIKIAIADYGDHFYDSAVFLKAQTPCP